MNSYPQILKELKKIVRKIPDCLFIPEVDKQDIVSQSIEQIYKAYLSGKLVDDFNVIKGYNFITVRNYCLQHKKKKSNKLKTQFEDWMVDNLIDDVDFDLSKPECVDDLKKQVIEHSHYYEFTDLQRRYIQLSFLDHIDYDTIKEILNLEGRDYQKVSNGAYHRLRGRKNKKYKYKIYPVDNPDNYLLFQTIRSVSKELGIPVVEIKNIIKNETIYNNTRIVNYEN